MKQRLDLESYSMLQYFFSYFEKIYVGPNEDIVSAGGPSHPIEFWSNNTIVLHRLPRTTNFAERWNRHINDRIRVMHLNIANSLIYLSKRKAWIDWI